jgi:hypothetical protein
MRYVLRNNSLRVYLGALFGVFLSSSVFAQVSVSCDASDCVGNCPSGGYATGTIVESGTIYKGSSSGSHHWKTSLAAACAMVNPAAFPEAGKCKYTYPPEQGGHTTNLTTYISYSCATGSAVAFYDSFRTNCSSAYTCAEPPPPPPEGCDEDGQFAGGPGQVGGQIATTGSQQEQIAFCTPFYDFDDSECSDVAGYVEFGGGRTQICNDDKNDCAASGGTYGFVGSGSEQLAVCLPSGLSDDLPTCDIITLQIDGATGSFVCASAPQPPDPDDPTADPGTNEPPGPSCIGPQCDALTGLCTGPNCIQYNGPPINSCTGPDCNTDTGECIGPDCEEVEIPSENKSSESEVSGGGTCDVAPSCKGDAILCSINFQLWRQRCESKLDESKVSGSGSCDGAPFVCQGDAIQCAILEQTRLARCASEGLFDTDFDPDGFATQFDPAGLRTTSDLEGLLSGVYSTSGPSGVCPAPITFNVAGVSLTISFQPFCDFAALLRPLVLLIFGYLSFRIIMRAF